MRKEAKLNCINVSEVLHCVMLHVFIHSITSNSTGLTIQRSSLMVDKFRRRTALPEELLYVKEDVRKDPQPLSPEHMPPPTRALTRVPSAPTSLK